MNSEIENEINLKMCKTCGLTENKFQPNRKECIKCKSKKIMLYIRIKITLKNII